MNTLNCIEYCILSFNEVLQFVYKNQEQNSFSTAMSSSVSDDPMALYKCFFYCCCCYYYYYKAALPCKA